MDSDSSGDASCSCAATSVTAVVGTPLQFTRTTSDVQTAVDTPLQFTSPSSPSTTSSPSKAKTSTSDTTSATQTTTSGETESSATNSPSPTSPPTTGTSAAAAATPSFGATGADSSTQQSGLSTAQIIGAVVGVVGGIALLLTIIGACQRMRHKSQYDHEKPSPINLEEINSGAPGAPGSRHGLVHGQHPEKSQAVYGTTFESDYGVGHARSFDVGNRQHGGTPPYPM